MIFSGELSSQFGDKILLQAEVKLCTAFKGNFDIEQWLQCSFNHVNNKRVEKFIADSCSVSVCQIVQINNTAVIIQE
jgi:hypothetical protein